ncbi:hypothetical protein ACQ4PT_005777 [Festuca glaucescens]
MRIHPGTQRNPSVHRSGQETKKPDAPQNRAEQGILSFPSIDPSKKPRRTAEQSRNRGSSPFHPSIRARNQDAQQSRAGTVDPLLPIHGSLQVPVRPDIPPAFKFDPTDADIVAYYLLPRALNLPNPYARAIIEDDPGSAPPWEILQRHGDVDHAFFFGPATDPSRNAGRRSRTVKGGVWQGQKGVEETVTLVRPGGGKVNIRYKRYDLSFYLAKGKSSTGYVMHEYEILSPPLPGTVLTRIKVTGKLKKQRAAAAEQQAPHPEQPVPMSNDEEFGGAQDGDPYGGGIVHDGGYYSTPLQYEIPLVEYDDYCISIPDQPGASYNYDAAAMDGEGCAEAQASTSYGGGMVENAGSCFDPSGDVPECGADYSNYYAEYQQWQYQQDRSNQYQAGDAAVVSGGGEQQAGGNSDNGSVVGTETSGHSTTSLCDGGVDLYDASFYNMLVCDHDDDFKCEQADEPHY